MAIEEIADKMEKGMMVETGVVARIERSLENIQTLEDAVASLQHEVAALRSAPRTAAVRPREPSSFDGECEKGESFIRTIENYIAICGTSLPGLTDRIQ